MIRQRNGLVLALVLVAALANGQSGALIDLDSGSSLVTNFKGRGVGDVVTIIIVEKTPIPEMGAFGTFQDPTGGVMAVWEAGPEASE